jgi:hypothetical protein
MTEKYTGSSTPLQLFELSISDTHDTDIESIALSLVGAISPYIDDLQTYVPEEARRIVQQIHITQTANANRVATSPQLNVVQYKFGNLQNPTVREKIIGVASRVANVNLNIKDKLDVYMVRACMERVQLGRLAHVTTADAALFDSALQSAGIEISQDTRMYITNVAAYGSRTSHITHILTVPKFNFDLINTIRTLDDVYDNLEKLQALTTLPGSVGANIDKLYNEYIPLMYAACYAVVYLRYSDVIIVATNTLDDTIYVNYYNTNDFDAAIKAAIPTLTLSTEDVIRKYIEYTRLTPTDPSAENAVTISRVVNSDIGHIIDELAQLDAKKQLDQINDTRTTLNAAVKTTLDEYYKTTLSEELRQKPAAYELHTSCVSSIIVKNAMTIDPDDIIGYLVTMRQRPLLTILYNKINEQFARLPTQSTTIENENIYTAILSAICIVVATFITAKPIT